MKKFLVFILLILVLFVGSAYGAVSDDVYLRRDVFDAKMEALMAEIRLGNQNLLEQIRGEMDKRFSEVDKRLSDLNDRFNTLDKKIDVLAERTDGTRTTVYWGLGFFGIIVALSPQFGEYIKRIRKPLLTVEDVEKITERTFERLIAAHGMKLAGK